MWNFPLNFFQRVKDLKYRIQLLHNIYIKTRTWQNKSITDIPSKIF